MSDKRFIVETVEIIDCATDKSRIAKVITDTKELLSCEDLYELCDDLNKLAEENEQLKLNEKSLHKIISIKTTRINTLLKKNEQLKHYKLYEDNKRLQTIIADLKKENVRLNEKIDNLIERAKNSESSNEYKLGAIQALQTLQKEL